MENGHSEIRRMRHAGAPHDWSAAGRAPRGSVSESVLIGRVTWVAVQLHPFDAQLMVLSGRCGTDVAVCEARPSTRSLRVRISSSLWLGVRDRARGIYENRKQQRIQHRDSESE